jgi:hypothetical protein
MSNGIGDGIVHRSASLFEIFQLVVQRVDQDVKLRLVGHQKGGIGGKGVLNGPGSGCCPQIRALSLS